MDVRTSCVTTHLNPPVRPLRIFVVENDADTLKALQRYLEKRGHRVMSAMGMKDALAALPFSDCDVLLSDIGLPDGDGWELLRTLSPQPRYAIAMSGYGTRKDQETSAQAGFRTHLVKPFSCNVLNALLEEAAREKMSCGGAG